jgi:hypothetical protein
MGAVVGMALVLPRVWVLLELKGAVVGAVWLLTWVQKLEPVVLDIGCAWPLAVEPRDVEAVGGWPLVLGRGSVAVGRCQLLRIQFPSLFGPERMRLRPLGEKGRLAFLDECRLGCH